MSDHPDWLVALLPLAERYVVAFEVLAEAHRAANEASAADRFLEIKSMFNAGDLTEEEFNNLTASQVVIHPFPPLPDGS
jgi:uncharacterized membrane protein